LWGRHGARAQKDQVAAGRAGRAGGLGRKAAGKRVCCGAKALDGYDDEKDSGW